MPAKNVTGRRIGAAFIDLALYTALCFGLFFLMAESSDGAVLLDATNIHFQLGETTWFVEGGAEVGLAPAAGAAAAPAVAPDWYPDPSGAAGMRWWDGQTWTAHTR